MRLDGGRRILHRRILHRRNANTERIVMRSTQRQPAHPLPAGSAAVRSCHESSITAAARGFICLGVAPYCHRHLLQVLDTLAYAERELLEAMPAFGHASVVVHLQSDVEVRADPC